jgi:glycosyltransferase involved in cell wall biosynthesis
MNFQPILITEIELSEPLKELSNANSTSNIPYGAAMLVVRLHYNIIGIVNMPFNTQVLRPPDYAVQIWTELGSKINSHLSEDGVQPIAGIPLEGIEVQDHPICLCKLDGFLENAPFVSVIVCTHDRTSFLKESLPYLLALKYPSYEIIVVDNAPSTLETYNYIQTEYQNNPRIRYAREDQAGVSWARNCGIRHSRAEFVAFTDDDAFADPYWLAYLMRNFSEMEEVACVTGFVLPFELEHESQVWFEQFGGFGRGIDRRVFDLKENRVDHVLYPYTVAQYGAGVNMAFRTNVLRRLKGFIVQINQADDISMFVKIITNGYKIVYEPNGYVYHKHRADYDGLRRQMYNYGIGLSHFLIHMIVSDWTWLFRVALRIPSAILYLLRTKSSKNKGLGYPEELTRLERKGLLAGPITYWQYARKIRGLHSGVEQEIE